jgi:hypothetical protein
MGGPIALTAGGGDHGRSSEGASSRPCEGGAVWPFFRKKPVTVAGR